MFFKFTKYNYKPSYEIKTLTRIDYLIKRYQNLFFKVIENKNSLSKEENDELFIGIEETKAYIINGLFYQILEDYNSKTSISKKAIALYNIAKYQYHDVNSFNDYIKEELIILAEDSIYEAIGFIEGKIFKLNSENANIIYYMKSLLFYKFINFLQNRVNSFKESCLEINANDILEDTLDKEEFIDNLLEESNLKKSISKELIDRLKENLLQEKIDEDLLPYVEFLSKLQNRGD